MAFFVKNMYFSLKLLVSCSWILKFGKSIIFHDKSNLWKKIFIFSILGKKVTLFSTIKVTFLYVFHIGEKNSFSWKIWVVFLIIFFFLHQQIWGETCFYQISLFPARRSNGKSLHFLEKNFLPTKFPCGKLVQ